MSSFDELPPIVSPASNDEEKWHKDRTGNVTGSRIFDIISRNKDGKYSSKRRDYLAEKIAERLTDLPYETSGFMTDAVKWGNDREAQAVDEYASWYPLLSVERLGKVYIPHPRISHAGCSPDALVGTVGGLEVKCPKTSTHLTYLKLQSIPMEYIPQVLWCLACTERDWWDFMSFDPRCREDMQTMVVRVWREHQQDAIRALEDEVEAFLAEIDKELLFWNTWKKP